MSQKVRIDGVKHVGASVFLGVDHCGNPCWTRNPERVMVWLCDGWRTRFNQRREQRPHNVPVKDEAGGIIDWVKEPLGGPNVADLLSDKEARLRCSWMAGIPAPILSARTESRIPNGSPDSNAGRPLEAVFPVSSRGIAALVSSAGATPPRQATRFFIGPAGSPVCRHRRHESYKMAQAR